jgi:signal transduction histidine kinase
MQTRANRVAWHFWSLMVLWSGAILVVFLADCWHLGRTMEEIALIEARAYLNKDRALRLWAASHGGVYVPVSPETPPNPNLHPVPERDVRTPNGQLLTLMNPEYIIRQIMSEFEQAYRVRVHITSRHYYRKETAPDAWEKTALDAFENGAQEVRAFTDIHGQPYLRVMRPLITKASCLKCHAAQGYKVGDVRGGVSLALPMAPYLEYHRKEIAAHALSFGVLWLLGVAGFWLAASKLSHFMKKHDTAEEELKISQMQLKHLMADLVRHQESERKAIALEIHEEIAQSLSAIKISLEAWMDTEAHSSGYGSQIMLPIIERIKADIDLIRRLTKRLSPIMLDDLGIKTAMETLCREITGACGNGKINLRVDVDDALLPSELKIAIYRVLEDLLTLVPDSCTKGFWTVGLNEFDGHMMLTIQTTEPCGAGCEGKSARGIELTAIKNRAAIFGGLMTVESGSENNCTFIVKWPLASYRPAGASTPLRRSTPPASQPG